MCSIKTCCCCISLEVGTQIISFLNLLVPLAEIGFCLYQSILLPLTEIKTTTVFIVLTVLAIFELFCACLFIYGTFKKQANTLWPWIVVAWVKSAVLVVLSVIGVTVLALTGDYGNYVQIICVTVYICYAVVLMYFSMVGNSRRREIKSETYWQYTPRRTRSNSAIVRNVYVPMTKQIGP